jgi:DNA adenine methylase
MLKQDNLLLYNTNNNSNICTPILKWAGGKKQLLSELRKLIPRSYNKYIEPFIGGGALFFDQGPKNSIIADSNYELINLYRVVRNNVLDIIKELKSYQNTEEFFYAIRALNPDKMNEIQRAARTLYLNKTCYNGLYRVNKKGKFNTPYGHYKRPVICNEQALKCASEILQQTIKIEHSDYKTILADYAEEGDFIFLDPPYLPISKYSDFKRYTKEQFHEKNHIELAQEVKKLCDKGCFVVLTNSNHPLINELYKDYDINVYSTRRSISCQGGSRKGEDAIITAFPKTKSKLIIPSGNLNVQVGKFPSTRYMGAKTKLLPYIRDVIKDMSCETVYDIFSGSGVVSYMLKTEGFQVFSNDYMAMNYHIGKALIENNTKKIKLSDAEMLIAATPKSGDNFVFETFPGLYFTDEENILIDRIRSNIKEKLNGVEKSIAIIALIRACIKKRPRGIFTYTGHRYDDGRKDLKLSLEDQFLLAVNAINDAIFDNGKNNKVRWGDALTIKKIPDLVYMDPPYYSPYSDNEYVRRYHFVEGIARDWQGVDIQWNTKTKKFKNYPTPFSTKHGTHLAFDNLFNRFKNSKIVVSYSSNSIPEFDDMVKLLKKYKTHVEVVAVDYRYSFATTSANKKNNVKEYLFVGY